MSKNSNPEYYDNEELWGGYQFITLEKVVNDYMALADEDDYTSRVSRSRVVLQAKRGFRELFGNAMRQIRAVQLTVTGNLTVVLPQDYVNFVRLSWVDSEGLLHPMAINRNLDMSVRYLQDHDGYILLDHEGAELEGDNNPLKGDPNRKQYKVCCGNFQPNRDYSNVYPNGSYNIDASRGIIQFSSNVETREIVLEYVSDGLYMSTDAQNERNIRVHKFADSCLRSFIYYELIKQRKNVSLGDKTLARREYYNDLRLLKKKMNPIRMADLLQAFKSANKWFKN